MRKSFTFTKKDFILLIILAITVLLVDYSLRWYHVYKEHNLNTPIISKYIVEVTSDDFRNYIAENSDALVYIGISDDDKCRSFEKRFRKIINKYNIENEIVYLNVKDTDLNAIINQYIVNELKDNNEFHVDVPAIVVYNNSRIVDFIDYNNSDMKDDEITKLLIKYGVIDYND